MLFLRLFVLCYIDNVLTIDLSDIVYSGCTDLLEDFIAALKEKIGVASL